MPSAEDQERARVRGERLREQIKELLSGGPQSAADLCPQMARDVTLSEVAFQLDRLAGEGVTVGERGKPYRLA